MNWFKEWWSTTLCSNNKQSEIIAEATYRATLERVLKEREAQGENHLKCVFDWIEQELNNE